MLIINLLKNTGAKFYADAFEDVKIILEDYARTVEKVYKNK
jgi:hypothetical protein